MILPLRLVRSQFRNSRDFTTGTTNSLIFPLLLSRSHFVPCHTITTASALVFHLLSHHQSDSTLQIRIQRERRILGRVAQSEHRDVSAALHCFRMSPDTPPRKSATLPQATSRCVTFVSYILFLCI